MAAADTTMRLGTPVRRGFTTLRKLRFRAPSIELLEDAELARVECQRRHVDNYTQAVVLLAVATGLPTQTIEALAPDDVVSGVDHLTRMFDRVGRRFEVSA